MELEDRSRRIVDSAVELAEAGGFEAVRLRDVASHAGVALGTLYRRFRSKEDLLVAAFEREMVGLEDRIVQRLPGGADPLERLMAAFTVLTRNFCRRPNLARALLRSLVSGDPELTERVADFHAQLERILVAVLRGTIPSDEQPATESERRVAGNMDLVWFALIIGWSCGVNSQSAVLDKTRDAAQVMLKDWSDGEAA